MTIFLSKLPVFFFVCCCLQQLARKDQTFLLLTSLRKLETNFDMNCVPQCVDKSLIWTDWFSQMMIQYRFMIHRRLWLQIHKFHVMILKIENNLQLNQFIVCSNYRRKQYFSLVPRKSILERIIYNRLQIWTFWIHLEKEIFIWNFDCNSKFFI